MDRKAARRATKETALLLGGLLLLFGILAGAGVVLTVPIILVSNLLGSTAGVIFAFVELVIGGIVGVWWDEYKRDQRRGM